MKRKVKAVNIDIIVGGLIMFVFISVALASPWIAPQVSDSPYNIPRDGFSRTPEYPSINHRLGTLPGQYDIFYGLVWGTRVAFFLGLIIVAGRFLLGSLIGLLSGYLGGALDAIIMRVTDGFMSFPVIAIMAVMIAIAGNSSVNPSLSSFPPISDRFYRIIIFTLIAFGWMQYARLIRGNVLVERRKEYIQAAIATGAQGWRIIFRHLLPNVTSGVFVLATSEIGGSVVLVASIYFIGLAGYNSGVLVTDWGQMLSIARDWVVSGGQNAFEYWFTYIPISMALILMATGWSIIGEGLIKLLDPKSR
jgi:peptide/nickel transport system permease protein